MTAMERLSAYQRIQAEADTAAHMVAAAVHAGGPFDMAHARRWSRAWAALDQTAREVLR